MKNYKILLQDEQRKLLKELDLSSLKLKIIFVSVVFFCFTLLGMIFFYSSLYKQKSKIQTLTTENQLLRKENSLVDKIKIDFDELKKQKKNFSKLLKVKLKELTLQKKVLTV